MEKPPQCRRDLSFEWARAQEAATKQVKALLAEGVVWRGETDRRGFG